MQREFIHFYKGYWIILTRLKDKFTIRVEDEEHRLQLESEATNRVEAKEVAEYFVDEHKTIQALAQAIRS